MYSPRAIYVYLHDLKMGLLPQESTLEETGGTSGEVAAEAAAEMAAEVAGEVAGRAVERHHSVIIRARSTTEDWSVALGSEIMAKLVKKNPQTGRPRCPQVARLYFTHMPRGYKAPLTGRRLEWEQGAVCGEAERTVHVCRSDPCAAWGGAIARPHSEWHSDAISEF